MSKNFCYDTLDDADRSGQHVMNCIVPRVTVVPVWLPVSAAVSSTGHQRCKSWLTGNLPVELPTSPSESDRLIHPPREDPVPPRVKRDLHFFQVGISGPCRAEDPVNPRSSDAFV